MADRETPKGIIFEEEIKHLLAGNSRIYKMTKEGEDDFYFDSTDLLTKKSDFIDMRQQGWELSEEVFEDLSSYLPTRTKEIADAGFESSGWGYKKK